MSAQAQQKKVAIESTSHGQTMSELVNSSKQRLDNLSNKAQDWLKTQSRARLAAYAAGVVALWVLSTPIYRWNIALTLYMPLLSGLYFNLTFLQPIFDAYVEFEIAQSPHLFEDQPLIEIQAEDYTWEHFMERTDNMRNAAVIRGLFSGSKALQTYGTEEWVEKHGDFSIQEINDVKKSYKYDYELVEKGTFKEYIADIRAGNYRYGYGLDEIYTKYPELVDDLEYSRYGRNDGKGDDFCRSVALFVSSGGEGLKWHNADHANLGMMVKGQKTFKLINPMYSPLLGPDGNKDPYATGFASRSPKRTFDKIPRLEVTLNPGDAILTPVWWWHRVQSHGDPESNLVMFNTCRFSDIKSAVMNQPVLELFRHTGFVNWLHPKVPVMSRWIPYFRVLQDGFREMFGLMPHWTSEDCFSSKREACDRYFKSIGWEIVKK